MKKLIIIYGIIGGAIVSAMMLITMPMYKSGTFNFDNGEITGYTTMVMVIFFAVKSYRDKQSNGTITFWKGVQIGMLITLIAGVMYAFTWEYLFADMGDEFMGMMTEAHMTELKDGGASDADIQKAREEMASNMEYYKNPFIRFPITIVEILPVGIIISLISAALLRRKEFLPATEQA
jgi:hypothetical protein